VNTRGKKSVRGRAIVFFCNTGGYVAAGTNLAAVHCAEQGAGGSSGKMGRVLAERGGLTNHDDRTGTP